MRIEKKEEAVSWWVRCLNEIPFDMIDDLMSYGFGHVHELTFPTYGDDVQYEGELWEVKEADGVDRYLIENENCKQQIVSYYDFEFSRLDTMPEHRQVWTFEGTVDSRWLQEQENLYRMSQLGFRIYESDYGLFFGVDEAGVDMYKKRWEPLYDLMWKRWHNA